MAPKVHHHQSTSTAITTTTIIATTSSAASADSISVDYMGSSSGRKKTFTLWMKSLVFHGQGFTVFDSNGKVVYRIDNYGEKCSQEVFLMDLCGGVHFTIRKKSLGLRCPCWEGFSGLEKRSPVKKEPWFRVKEHRCRRLFGRRNLTCETVSSNGCIDKYRIMSLTSAKSGCKIINSEEKTIAEVKQKQGCGGQPLGKDVLSLEVDEGADQVFVMALVAVSGLINGQI